MEQLKSYFSRRRQIGNVLVVGRGSRVSELVFYLEQERKVTSVTVTAEEDAVALRNLVMGYQIDTIVFDQGWTETLKRLTGIRVRYLVGWIEANEDYFGLWERHREQAQHLYFARERVGERGRDVDRYEVLEWDKKDSPTELSVIIPVYNVREYLGACIESLTAWEAPYVEYLFVDDGSTDGSCDLIDAWAERDHRVRRIGKANGGCASARNLGLREASGNYVGFVDGDDFVDRQMFCKLLRRAMMGNYELAYCGYMEYEEETGETYKVLNDCMGEPYLTGTYRTDYVQKLVIQTRVAIWRCIYRRDFLLREGIVFHQELRRFDDLPFKVESGFKAKSAVCVPEHLYYYRIGRRGQDVSCSDNRLFVHFDIFRILDDIVVPMKNRQLIDYLQIVKLHTHGYALKKIDRKYYRKYLKMARAQLNEMAGTVRTLCLMMLYGGRGNIWWYLISIYCVGFSWKGTIQG